MVKKISAKFPNEQKKRPGFCLKDIEFSLRYRVDNRLFTLAEYVEKMMRWVGALGSLCGGFCMYISSFHSI